MARIGMATVKSQAIALLQAGMAAKVAEINAAFDDGHDLLVPNTLAYYTFLVNPKFIHSYPAIVLFNWQSRANDQHIGDEYDIARQFVVDVVEKGTTREDITLKLERWEMVIFELLAAEVSLACGACSYVATDWNQPILTNRAEELLQDVPLLFSVSTYETP